MFSTIIYFSLSFISFEIVFVCSFPASFPHVHPFQLLFFMHIILRLFLSCTLFSASFPRVHPLNFSFFPSCSSFLASFPHVQKNPNNLLIAYPFTASLLLEITIWRVKKEERGVFPKLRSLLILRFPASAWNFLFGTFDEIMNDKQIICMWCPYLCDVRDHPYITSAHFWTFADPPPSPVSA